MLKNTLCRFVSTVSCLVTNAPLTAAGLASAETSLETYFEAFQYIEIPLFSGGSPFEMPGFDNVRVDSLKRPRDVEQCDGITANLNGRTDLFRVECKNHQNGIEKNVFEGVLKNFLSGDSRVLFLFVSFLNRIWRNSSACDKFFKMFGVQKDQVLMLRISKGEEPCWWSSASKYQFDPKPGDEEKYLVIIFEVGCIDLSSDI